MCLKKQPNVQDLNNKAATFYSDISKIHGR